MHLAADEEKIKWSFNPPSAPHFGGLWEAGVKSFKTHLKRVVGDQILSIEEFSTVLAQIEAVLNSRPLCPLSTDPSDLEILSPGHFLTMEPLVSIPTSDLTPLLINRLSRWQLIEKIHEDFWKHWHQEYLHANNAPNGGVKLIRCAKILWSSSRTRMLLLFDGGEAA